MIVREVPPVRRQLNSPVPKWLPRLAAALVAVVISGGSALLAGDVTTVILVRHAEKELTGGDVPLSAPGVERSLELIEVVRSAGVTTVIHSKYQRTRLTVEPSVEKLGLAADRVLTLTEPEDVAGKILADLAGQTVLVAGHSNTVPQIVEALGAPSLCPPFEVDEKWGCMLPDPEYHHLFVVTIPETGTPTVLRARFGNS